MQSLKSPHARSSREALPIDGTPLRRWQRGTVQNSTLSVTWFSVGLVLTTATQLRQSASGIGLGELLLACWSATSLLALAAQRRFDHSHVVKALLVFWTVALSALAMGMILDPVPLNWASVSHDGQAILFVALVMLSFAAPNGFIMRFRRTLILTLSLALVSLLLLWFAAFAVSTIGPVTLWYGPRFIGWAENPNQVALLMTPAPFVCCHLASSLRGSRRYAVLLLGLAAVVLGVASQSDALRVSWALTTVFVIVTGWSRVAIAARTRSVAALIAFGLTPIVAMLILSTFASHLSEAAVDVGRHVYEEGHQGPDRVAAWRGGIAVILDSPVFGKGPGTHSTEYMSLNGIEAHNTIIDWGTNTGMVGIAAYLGLLLWATITVWRSGSVLLGGALLALFSFNMFGYVLRQPVYWFYVVAILALSQAHTGVSCRLARYARP